MQPTIWSHFARNAAIFTVSGFVLLGCDIPPGHQGDGHNTTVVEPVVVADGLIASAQDLSGAATAQVERPRPGVVTAGDIDDALNFDQFERYAGMVSRGFDIPTARLGQPILAQLVGPSGQPAPGVRVTLRAPGASDAIYSGYSGVDGMVSVFPDLVAKRPPKRLELRAFPEGGAEPATYKVRRGSDRQRIVIADDHQWRPDFLDLVFVLDTTSSMMDELAWLSQEVHALVSNAKQLAPGVDVRLGFVSYKAKSDVFSVRNYGFTKNAGTFREWVRAQNPDGGSGSAEYVARALRSAVDMKWRRGKGERLIIQIGDEPPEFDQIDTYYNAMADASGQGIQIHNLAASGVEQELEFLMRQGAAATGGRYMFLTDDSGVGATHGEPAIACYQVTRLTGLITRVVASELSGLRVEPPKDRVIREVGSYRRGVCLE